MNHLRSLVSSVGDNQVFNLSKSESKCTWSKLDLLIAVILAVSIFLVVFAMGMFHIRLLVQSELWFDGDTGRAFQAMVWHDGNHTLTQVHPLFPTVTLPLTYFLRKVFNFTTVEAVRVIVSLSAALWLTSLFALLRLAGCRRLDAVLFSGLGAVSAAAMFWLTVPETYSLSSVTLIGGLCFAALTQYKQFPFVWYVGANLLTLSITVTNWMVGIATTVITVPWKRSFQIFASAIGVLFFLTFCQKLILKNTIILGLFEINDQTNQTKFLLMSESGGVLRIIPAFFYHTIVMPALNLATDRMPNVVERLTVQPSLPGSGSIWGLVAVAVWTALLGIGIWSFLTVKDNQKLHLVLGVTLIGQVFLHLLYGNETFLYSMNFLPLLILLVAFGVQTSKRRLCLILVSILILTAGINNALQLRNAVEFLQKIEGPIPKLVSSLDLVSPNYQKAGGHGSLLV